MVYCSVGIMAYNEAANIGRLLDNLIAQKHKIVKITEIIVVASGCSDRTENIVSDKARQSKLIKLVIEKRRLGKASAINLFIKKAKNPVLVMISADTLPKNDAIEKLVTPFEDKKVGMTSARIIPLNNPNTFMGFYVRTFWILHHEVAKKYFKAGELVAWRNVISGIDPYTSTDETNIAALIMKKGYQLAYMPSSMVYNKGPENIGDFLKVRRRHLSAYYHLNEQVGLSYKPPTMSNILVLKLLWSKMKPKSAKDVVWTGGVIMLEGLGKMLAWYDWRLRHEHHAIWPMATSTKTLPDTL